MEGDEFHMEETPTAGVKTLDSRTASQLRTAQVIVKISDVVRELVENSVDAEAKTIKVLLEKNGLDKIEVRDDGQGISSEGVGVIFKGGYTSKLESTTNLSRSKWLGFRGEALNAICASGKVSVISKTSDAPAASKYELDSEGNVLSVSAGSLNRGTVITLANIFEKTPVRRQANQNAKVVQRELKEIETYLKGVGISNPKCHLSLIHNGNLSWSKPSVHTIEQALIAVLGHSISKNIKKCGPLKVMKDMEDKDRLIEMYLPVKPVDMRKMSFTSNQLAMIFCNRKRVYIREYEKLIHRYVTSVVDKQQPADQRRFPFSFLFIDVPPEEVDFNRDMDKTKVFLIHKDAIYETLEQALIKFYEIDLRTTDGQQPQDSTINSTSAATKSTNQTDEKANQACVDNLVTAATPLNNLSAEGRQSTILEFLQDIPQNSDAFTKSPVKPPNSGSVAVTFPVSKTVSLTETGILRNTTNLGARDTTASEASIDEERRRLPEVVSNFEIDLDFLEDATQFQPSCAGKGSVAGEAVLSKEIQVSKQNYDNWLEGRMLDKNGEIIQNVIVVNQPPTLPDKEDAMERFRLALTAGKRHASSSCPSPYEPFFKRSRMDSSSLNSTRPISAPATPRIPSLNTPTHRQVTLQSLSNWPTPTSVFSQAASNAVVGVRLPMTPISYRISQDSPHATPNRRIENIAKSVELFEKQQQIGGKPSPMEINGNPTPDQHLGIDQLVTTAQGQGHQPISSDWPAVAHYLKNYSSDRLPSKINGKIESDASAGPLYFAQTQDSIGIFSPRNMINYFPSECGLNQASSLGDISFSEDDVSELFSLFISAPEFNQASAVSSKIFHVLRTVASLKNIRDSMKSHPHQL